MKALLIATTLCVAQLGAAEKGFTPLFNGKDISGWQGIEGPNTNWVAKDGILSCTGKKGSQWIATKKEFSNFDLRLEYKISTDGNSGVFIRAPKEGNPWVTGLEIQVYCINI